MVCLIRCQRRSKTTTLNALAEENSGHLAGGRLIYDGEAISTMPAHKRLCAEASLVPEGRGVFTRLTVGRTCGWGLRPATTQPAIEGPRKVYTMLPRVKERLQRVAGTLSGGEQRMVRDRSGVCCPDPAAASRRTVDGTHHWSWKIFGSYRPSGTKASPSCWSSRTPIWRSNSRSGYVMDSGKISITGSGEELLANPAVRATLSRRRRPETGAGRRPAVCGLRRFQIGSAVSFLISQGHASPHPHRSRGAGRKPCMKAA